MDELSKKTCVPCEGGALPLMKEDSNRLLEQVPGWTLSPDGLSISRAYSFERFDDAMVFANRVADIAESEGHHPDMLVQWGKVTITLSTHSIGGLSENDFILAAKIDEK